MHTVTYCTASSKAGCGVCKSRRSGRSTASMPAVSASATHANTVSVVPMARFTLPYSPWPVYCPMMTVLPSVRPVTRLVTICVTCVPVETAATLCAPQKAPTTNRSAAPYSDCSTFATRNGQAKRNSVLATLPCVRLFGCMGAAPLSDGAAAVQKSTRRRLFSRRFALSKERRGLCGPAALRRRGTPPPGPAPQAGAARG